MRPFPPNASPAERLALTRDEVRAALGDPMVRAWSGVCVEEALRREAFAASVGVEYAAARAYVDVCMRSLQRPWMYVADPPGRDLYGSVRETLLGGDDCEGLSGALCALVDLGREAGLACWARLAWLLQENAAQDHVTALVSFDGGGFDLVIAGGSVAPAGWQWADVTLAAARGEHPYDALARMGAGHGRINGA